MAPRGLLVIAILAIAGGIAWFALRGHGSDLVATDPVRAPAPGSNPEVAPGSATVVVVPQRTPDRPVLPEVGPRAPLPDGGTPTLAQLYANEPRDLDWGPRTEKEIAHQLAHMKGGSLDNAECHVSHCELTLSSSDEKGMQVAIGELEAKRGLAGIATTMMLTAPDRHPDGSLVLRVFASFVR